jgi:hypothetical protein
MASRILEFIVVSSLLVLCMVHLAELFIYVMSKGAPSLVGAYCCCFSSLYSVNIWLYKNHIKFSSVILNLSIVHHSGPWCPV